MFNKYLATAIVSICVPVTTWADSFHSYRSTQRVYQEPTHAGERDTDGILSPGEIRNPNIDYDRAQRRLERHGDTRVENPINDDAAADSRYIKEREQEQAERDNRWRNRRDEERDRSWWRW